MAGDRGARRGGETLSRLGVSFGSAAQFGRTAAAAERAIGIHGLSLTTAGEPGPHSRASWAGVASVFRLHDTQTSRDPRRAVCRIDGAIGGDGMADQESWFTAVGTRPVPGTRG